MTPSTSKRGSSLDAAPIIKEMTREEKSKPLKSKQTIALGRKALKRIHIMCREREITFQSYVTALINKDLLASGEPTIEEMEAEQ